MVGGKHQEAIILLVIFIYFFHYFESLSLGVDV
jgi:hypothetical protein